MYDLNGALWKQYLKLMQKHYHIKLWERLASFKKQDPNIDYDAVTIKKISYTVKTLDLPITIFCCSSYKEGRCEENH